MKRLWVKKKTGKHIVHFPNGNTKEKGTYKDGKKDELWTHWRENGKKWVEGNYKDGKKDGLWT